MAEKGGDGVSPYGPVYYFDRLLNTHIKVT